MPYSLTAELREVWDQVVDNLDSIGDFLEDAADAAGDLGIWGIFLLLGALILAALAAAAALIDAVLGALTTLGSATIRYVACLIYEQLYNAFETFRLAVAMNGLAFPMLEHLSDPRITPLREPGPPDANGNNGRLDQGPPADARAVVGAPVSPTTSGTSCIHRTADELPAMSSRCPSSYLDKTSTWYAWGDIPQKAGILNDLLELTPSANTAQNDDGTQLAGIFDDKNLLGNALMLAEAMYEQVKAGGELPDFNLDGDRGYGFLCWSQQGDPASDFPDPVASAGDPPRPVPLNFIR